MPDRPSKSMIAAEARRERLAAELRSNLRKRRQRAKATSSGCQNKESGIGRADDISYGKGSSRED
jgi:hypothetical protein